MGSRLIDFRHAGRSRLPALLGLQSRAMLSDPTLLTPRVMRWSPQIWLLDLRPCLSYWQQVLPAEPEDPTFHLEQLLKTRIPGDAPYRLACADSPWHAISLLTVMQARNMDGALRATSPLGQSLLRRMPWAVWFESLCQLTPHLCSLSPSVLAAWKRQQTLMQRAVDRLGLQHVGQLQPATPASIQRRFGKIMAQVWRWSGPSDPAEGFPWQTWQREAPLMVQRHLDYGVWQWEQMVPWLCQDLDRLCEVPGWREGERVTELAWILTLDDLTEREQPLHFRHPHDVGAERGHHRTVLRLASLQYANLCRVAQDDHQPLQQVVGWRLECRERFHMPCRTGDLFDLHRARHNNLSRAQSLQNQVAVPLQRFQSRPDFLPEDAAETQSPLCSENSHMKSERPARSTLSASSSSLVKGARFRPLFLYTHPRPLPQPPRQRCFLERIQVKWWRQALGGDLSRDYFRVQDARQRHQWIYYDGTGWYVQGTYS